MNGVGTRHTKLCLRANLHALVNGVTGLCLGGYQLAVQFRSQLGQQHSKSRSEAKYVRRTAKLSAERVAELCSLAAAAKNKTALAAFGISHATLKAAARASRDVQDKQVSSLANKTIGRRSQLLANPH
jgi:hypothetical protein